MFVPNFKAISHVTLVLGPKNRPKSLAKKPSQSKTAEVQQKTFHTVICRKIPFHPNQPTFGRDEVFFLFFFFFLILVRSSPKPQNIKI